MDNVWTDVMTDGTDDELTDSNIAGNECRDVPGYFSPLVLGSFDGDSADSVTDGMNDILYDGMTDNSNDVHINGNLPGSWTVKKFSPKILLGTYTMNSADGMMDGIDNSLLTNIWTSRWKCEWTD